MLLARNLLDHTLKHNCKSFIFSTSEIYGDPDPKNIPTKENYRGFVVLLARELVMMNQKDMEKHFA